MSGIANEVSLKYFCVCNVSLGQKEGEEEKKILYYFPKGTNKDIQVKEIGLCQAIIKFSQTFSSDPCESVYTEKTKRVFYEAEPNYWFIMSVNGGKCVEGLKSMLIQCYKSIRLFLGPLDRLSNKSPDNIKNSLETILTKYIHSTIVGTLITREPCEVFRGLQFLPLDRAPFLQVISTLNRIESTHSEINYSLILHNDSLIWSGLPAEDTQIVFRYLTISLLPTFLKQEKQSKSPLDPNSSTTNGRFVCGPTANDLVNVRRIPRLYLHGCTRHGNGFHYMVVYRLPLTTIAWFLTDKADLGMELFRSLEKACREEIVAVVDTFKADLDGGLSGGSLSSSSSSSGTDNDVRYVYFNKMNLAVKCQPQQGHVSSLILSLFTHHDRLVEEGCTSVESIAKTDRDKWVCARSSNSRHFFLSSSDRKRYYLDDFNKEVNRICDKQLSTIFFHV